MSHLQHSQEDKAGKLLYRARELGCKILRNIERQNNQKEVHVMTQIFWCILVFLLIPILSFCTFCTLGQTQSSSLTGSSEYETLWLQKTLVQKFATSLIIAYQSHNNGNDLELHPGRSRD